MAQPPIAFSPSAIADELVPLLSPVLAKVDHPLVWIIHLMTEHHTHIKESLPHKYSLSRRLGAEIWIRHNY